MYSIYSEIYHFVFIFLMFIVKRGLFKLSTRMHILQSHNNHVYIMCKFFFSNLKLQDISTVHFLYIIFGPRNITANISSIYYKMYYNFYILLPFYYSSW